MRDDILTANFILYCAKWEETARFYRDRLELPVATENDWFVEFRLGADSRLSVADERKATIKSCGGAGVTVSIQVPDVQAARDSLTARGLQPTEIKRLWDDRVFYLHDPEGHRIELWQAG